MPRKGLPDSLHFRVSIGVRSPLYPALTPFQPTERPAALLRLAQAGLARDGGPAVAELKRIADTLERLQAAGIPWSAAAAQPPASAPDPGSSLDPRIVNIDKNFQDD